MLVASISLFINGDPCFDTGTCGGNLWPRSTQVIVRERK